MHDLVYFMDPGCVGVKPFTVCGRPELDYSNLQQTRLGERTGREGAGITTEWLPEAKFTGHHRHRFFWSCSGSA